MREALRRLLLETEPARIAAPGRDLRLDFFRGVALVFIFLNHIPENIFSWLTNRYFGFSDATEIFVFISGYSVALAYGGIIASRGLAAASAAILRRVWQIYVAHVFIFVLFLAQIGYFAARFDSPMFAEEMGVMDFAGEPHRVVLEALLLRFKPVNMDVLPLYVVLLVVFPPVLWALRRWPLTTLGAAFALYLLAPRLGWNLTAFPGDRGWAFNPFCWQFLFVFGAFCGLRHGQPMFGRLRRRVFVPPALLYLAFSLAIVMTWNFPVLERLVPNWIEKLIYPIDKTQLDILRLLHFLALGYVVATLVPAGSSLVRHALARPLVLLGQHSLHVFCVGVLLSFVAHFVLSEFGDTLIRQLVVNSTGIGAMLALAMLLAWYRHLDRNQETKGGVAP